jgi:hypothetical protein
MFKTHQARQYSANFSSSLEATPDGVEDLFRALGGGVGLPLRPGLERPEKVEEVGETTPTFDPGLVGGVMELVDGKS